LIEQIRSVTECDGCMTYKILAKTISNDNVLTFTKVEKYTIKDGFLIFIDSRKGKERSFRVENTEIEEE